MSSGELVHTISFYFLGIISVLAALIAVSSKRILRAAVGLAVTLVCGAGFYILLNYDFIAGIQLLVFVGGIVVLIVYAIMLTSSLEFVEDHPPPMRRALAILSAVIFLVVSLTALINTNFSIDSTASQHEEITANLGRMLLSTGPKGYVLPFEIISLLLLAAVIGGIVIARSYRDKVENIESGDGAE